MIQSFTSPSYPNSEARPYFRSQSRISCERRKVTHPGFNVIDQPPGKHHVHKHSFVRACNRQRKIGQHRNAMTPKRQRTPQTTRPTLVDVHVPTSLQHAHRPAFHSFSKVHTLPVGCVRTVLQNQRQIQIQTSLSRIRINAYTMTSGSLPRENRYTNSSNYDRSASMWKFVKHSMEAKFVCTTGKGESFSSLIRLAEQRKEQHGRDDRREALPNTAWRSLGIIRLPTLAQATVR